MHCSQIVFGLATLAQLLQCSALGDTIPPQSTGESEQCIDSLHVAQQVIISNPYNRDSIDNALYPVNSHPAIVVTVKFYFNATHQNTTSLPKHPSTLAGQQLNVEPDYIFQWLSAPLFLPLGMEAMEMFGMAIISISKHEAHIVLSPLCEDSAVEILSKVTTKLQILSNADNDKERGFSVQIIPQNNGSSATRLISNTKPPTGKKLSLGHKEDITANPYLFLLCMIIIPIIVSCSLPSITSLLIQKQQLILTPSQLVQDSSQLKISTFLGLSVVCSLDLLVVATYDSMLFYCGRKVWFFYFLLPVPVFLPIFLFIDIIAGINAMILAEKLHKLKDKIGSPKRLRFFKVIAIIGCVVITLFMQMVSFHFHWFFFMLVNFPMEVGSIFVAYIAFFCSEFFIASGFFHAICWMCFGSTSQFRANELCGMGNLFCASSILSTVYSMMVIIGGVNYHDGMSSLMPNFLPYIIIAFFLWFLKKSKLTERPPGAEEEEHYLQQKMSLYSNEEKMKLLSNEEA